ncbi:hypothetical protein D3C81_933590 [compost metagenome]
MSLVIQVPSCPPRGVVAQARITAAKSSSTRISQSASRSTRRSVLRSVTDTRNASGASTMRGSVLHHSTGWPLEYQGKMPCRYASSRRWGDSSRLAASRPGASESGPSASSTGGNGSCGSSQVIMRAVPGVARAGRALRA